MAPARRRVTVRPDARDTRTPSATGDDARSPRLATPARVRSTCADRSGTHAGVRASAPTQAGRARRSRRAHPHAMSPTGAGSAEPTDLRRGRAEDEDQAEYQDRSARRSRSARSQGRCSRRDRRAARRHLDAESVRPGGHVPVDGRHDPPMDDVDARLQRPHRDGRATADRPGPPRGAPIVVRGHSGRIEHADRGQDGLGPFEERRAGSGRGVAEPDAVARIRRSQAGVRRRALGRHSRDQPTASARTRKDRRTKSGALCTLAHAEPDRGAEREHRDASAAIASRPARSTRRPRRGRRGAARGSRFRRAARSRDPSPENGAPTASATQSNVFSEQVERTSTGCSLILPGDVERIGAGPGRDEPRPKLSGPPRTPAEAAARHARRRTRSPPTAPRRPRPGPRAPFASVTATDTAFLEPVNTGSSSQPIVR